MEALSDSQTIRHQTGLCHFDRSEAEWRNLTSECRLPHCGS